jgi:hypothetical protein
MRLYAARDERMRLAVPNTCPSLGGSLQRAEAAGGALTGNDWMRLGHWRVGVQPGMDWLAGQPSADKVHARLVKFMDPYVAGD